MKDRELWKTYTVLGLAYDRWRIADLLREFDRLGFAAWEDKGNEEAGHRSSARSRGARASRTWRRRSTRSSWRSSTGNLSIRRIRLTWNMANAVATMDPAGNRKLDKDKARFRIDARSR
jgi:hypothetical protein